MIKMMAVITRREGMDPAEFTRIWRDEHTQLVMRLPGLRGYRQNHAVPHHREWPFDGVVELWFDDMDAARAAFRSEPAAAVRAHEQIFVQNVQTIVVQEHSILLPPS